MFVAAHGSAIYDILDSGKVINKHTVADGVKVPNGLYNHVMSNLEEYEQLYKNIGRELVAGEDYFYLIGDKSFNEATRKICGLLIIIMRIGQSKGWLFDHLIHEAGGISKQDADNYEKIDAVIEVKESIGCKNTLWNELLNNLRDRDIARLNSAGKLVLTDAGKQFYLTMEKQDNFQDFDGAE